jgi:hypothetical protein
MAAALGMQEACRIVQQASLPYAPSFCSTFTFVLSLKKEP